MEFSRPEYWSREPFPSPGDLPNLRIKPRSPTLQADSLPAEPQGMPKNAGVGSPSLLQGQTDSLPADPQGKPKNAGVGSPSLLQRQADSLPAEPKGKPKNAGVGSHPFPRGGQILYQLSPKGSLLTDTTETNSQSSKRTNQSKEELVNGH